MITIKKYLKYTLSPYLRKKCRISFIYSTLSDLDEYGIINTKVTARKFKKHRKQFINNLKPKKFRMGDSLIIVNCIEAETNKGKIWTARTDEFEYYGGYVIMLEGYSGCFGTECLEKIK